MVTHIAVMILCGLSCIVGIAVGYVKDIRHKKNVEAKMASLEKEIDYQWKNCTPVDEGMGCEFANISIEQFADIAKHFFELGIKAQKGE